MKANEPGEWIFTFGYGQPNQGKCVRIRGDYHEARRKMISKYGLAWAFQYSAKKWDEWKKDPLSKMFSMEEEIPWGDEHE